MHASSSGLDGGVEGQKVGLECYLVDGFNDFRNLRDDWLISTIASSIFFMRLLPCSALLRAVAASG